MKAVAFDLACDLEKGHRDGGGQNDLGGDLVLIVKRSESEGMRLAGRQKDSQAGSVGVMDKHIGALPDLRQRGFLCSPDVVEVAGEADQHASIGPCRKKPSLEPVESCLDRR